MADLFKKLHDKRARLFSQLSDPAAVGVWKMVVDKYSDQAHFLFELLQNADDARATYVRISLYPDKLYFIHNGSLPFSITDVDDEEQGKQVGHLNAITSIGASSKSGTNSIGKFGLGFKSVFQYTDTPHIEDDGFCFKIVNYIVPEKDESVSDVRKKGETLFAIPFREPSKAFLEVKDKLSRLKHPLLFLSSLLYIEWSVVGGESGTYERKIREAHPSMNDHVFVEEKQTIGSEKNTLYHHIFSQDFSTERNGSLKGSVAFSAMADGSLNEHSSADDVAYCYFPTKERTDLKFLIHAPFLLTDSREGIKQGEDWNVTLVDQLATLAANALQDFTLLKNNSGESLLGDNLFSIIPLEQAKFYRKTKQGGEVISLFSAFYDRFVEKLSSAPLFQSLQGFVDCHHTRYAADKELMSLLDSSNELALLPAIGRTEYDWSFLTIKSDDREVLDYIRRNGLMAVEVTPTLVLKNLNVAFLQCQSNDWLKRFYGYFASCSSDWDSDYARKKLLIRCADGQFLPACAEDGKSLIFLSEGASNSFATVDKELQLDALCRRLFSQLNISHPDALSEIESIVLPRYKANEVAADDWTTIFRDMNLFVDAYQSLRFMDSRLERFLSMFADVPLFPSTDNNGQFALRKASEVYVELLDLKRFLAYDSSVAFLDARLTKDGFAPEKREAFYCFISAIGVSFGLKIKKVRRSPKSKEGLRLALTPKSLRQYDNGDQQIDDCEIEGYDSFLAHISETSSVAFFKLLSSLIERQSSYMLLLSLEGVYRYVEKAKKTYTEEVIKHTSAWHSIFSDKWLYDTSGELKSPKEIGSVLNLASAYTFDSVDILFFLGIQDDESLRGLNQEQRRAMRLIHSFESEGITAQQLERLLKDLIQGNLPDVVVQYLKGEE